MKAMIKLHDNQLKHEVVNVAKSTANLIQKSPQTILLKDYVERNDHNILFSLFDEPDKQSLKYADAIIAKIDVNQLEGGNKIVRAETGNFIGKICWPVGNSFIDIEISSRFPDVFLQRMLSFVNDIFISDVEGMSEEDKKPDSAKFILYYLFVQALEKAYLLGLPKEYQTVKHHEANLKGKLDINRFIRDDMPYKGKLSANTREQVEVIEIVDVIYHAVTIVSKDFNSLVQRIKHITPHLKQVKSIEPVSLATIKRAKQAKSLQNPVFSSYKRVLKYAELIVRCKGLKENNFGNNKSPGFLIDVAELFEIYISKLLAINFSSWQVSSPKILVYEGLFFSRKIIPDIVMTKGVDVMVFDTKYKRMLYRGRSNNGMGDLDRNDFFQINTYMSYYQNIQPENKLIAGGLLYPMEEKFSKESCHSQSWFGNDNVRFIIDGIDLSRFRTNPQFSINDLIESEKIFIKSVRELVQ